MKRLFAGLVSIAFACPLAALAQQAVDARAPAAQVVPEAAKQFDFLLGQWSVEVHPKVSSLVAMIHGTPRLVGTWKAWRAPDGVAVEDELRVVDASGNPVSTNRSRRVYAVAEGGWKISATDAAHARASVATAHWAGGEMRVDGQYNEAGGEPTLTRTRYYDITADSFRMQQDRSTDGGSSWDEGALTIDAKRVAASATP